MAVVAVIAAGAALAGCVQDPPAVIPTSPSSVAPVFKTDAEALAAAKVTYDGYLAALDSVAHKGGAGSEVLANWDTPAQLGKDEKSLSILSKNMQHTSGSSTYSHFVLQSADSISADLVRVAVYVCLDESKTKLLDRHGKEVPGSASGSIPLEVTFRSKGSNPRSLVIEGSEAWQGKDFCS
jgi:hypothetical protein